MGQQELLLKQQQTREEVLNLIDKIPSKRILYFLGVVLPRKSGQD
jgi:hypothetical protein